MRPFPKAQSPVLNGKGTDRISLAGSAQNAKQLVEAGRGPAGVARLEVGDAQERGVELRRTPQLKADIQEAKASSEAELRELQSRGAGKDKIKRVKNRLRGADAAGGYLQEYGESHAVGDVPPEALAEVRSIESEVAGERARTVGKGLGRILLAYGIYTTTKRVSGASPEHRDRVVAEELGGWSGGLAGAEAGALAGSSAGPWGALVGGLIGGFVGSGVGHSLVSAIFDSRPPLANPAADQPMVLRRVPV